MSAPAKPRRVALVHDWLTGHRGGEQVLLQLCKLYPQAHLFTLVHLPGQVAPLIEDRPIYTSFIQRLMTPSGRFRHLLPLFPCAIASMDVSRYDLVISTSHCVAHGVRARKGTVHVAYIHTPMRYLYDQMAHYLPKKLARALPIAQAATAPLRRWNRMAAQRPHLLVANSAFVAERIRRVWRRDAQVVHPPVQTDGAAARSHAPETAISTQRSGLLWVGALVPYKRVDLCVALSNAMQVPLTVVGRGPALLRLRTLAGPQVNFLSQVSAAELQELYCSHEALLYPGEEDFGIAPVEAMARGCPILGLNRGGLKETVVTQGPGTTGVLVDQADVQTLIKGLMTLRRLSKIGLLQPHVLKAQAQKFSQKTFAQRFASLVDEQLQRARAGLID